MGSYKIAKTGRIVSKRASSPSSERGVIVLRSDSTGLYGGKDTELKINGKVQRFDWDKAMMLVSPKSANQKF